MQSKFNPFHRKYLFVPVISERHWNLAVVMNPSKVIRRLKERNPPKEYFAKVSSLLAPTIIGDPVLRRKTRTLGTSAKKWQKETI